MHVINESGHSGTPQQKTFKHPLKFNFVVLNPWARNLFADSLNEFGWKTVDTLKPWSK